MALVSSSAIDGRSAFHQNGEVVEIARRMVASATRRYLMVDHREFGRTALHRLTDLGAFDGVVTTRALARETARALSEDGITLHFAEDEQDMGDAPPVWIGTSWKMNHTLAEARRFAEALAAAPGDGRIRRFVIPPFTAVREVKAVLSDTDVLVGAQNMHWADEGAWTGEVSPVMLTDCGADIVELGHSERRRHFGESDETVGLKVEAAVRHGLIPLICIGETAAEKEAGRADEVLGRQVEAALGRLRGRPEAPILLAYEPVWAIGEGGTPASPDYACDRQARIVDAARAVTGRRLPCLYGGSVDPGNAADLVARPNIDGLFVGRSAWAVEGYLDILSRCAAVI